jgi:hypothetical protein
MVITETKQVRKGGAQIQTKHNTTYFRSQSKKVHDLERPV